MGVNQFITVGNNGANYTLNLPAPSLLNGGCINIYSTNPYITTLSIPSGTFAGIDGTSSSSFNLNFNTRIQMFSNGQDYFLFKQLPQSKVIFVSSKTIFTASSFNNNQYIEFIDNNITSSNTVLYSVYLPDPNYCENQVIFMFNNNNKTNCDCRIYITGSSTFIGRYPNTGTTFAPLYGGTYQMISNYYNWVIM